MSTNLNTFDATVAPAEAVTSPISSGIAGFIGRVQTAWGQARAMRRAMGEIGGLSDRELADIGLTHDEIMRLRNHEMFVPRAWSKVERSELPF